MNDFAVLAEMMGRAGIKTVKSAEWLESDGCIMVGAAPDTVTFFFRAGALSAVIIDGKVTIAS